LIESEGWHLDSNLALSGLAFRVDHGSHSLSAFINATAEVNFYTFIAELRVQTFLAKLREPGSQEKTILEMAFAWGFTSKASFNAMFRKITGLTPRQAREQTKPEGGDWPKSVLR
jgi:AraC-like DNA-binding protein